jgi:hypothetical protein
MRLPVLLTASVLLITATIARTEEFESPPLERPGDSLPASMVSGQNFRLFDPVQSDGIMRQYVIDSRFGVFRAYGRIALAIRLNEVRALTVLSKTSAAEVVTRAARQSFESQLKSVGQVAKNPVGTVVGIPKGVAHLFGGYAAQAKEISARAQKSGGSGGAGQVASDVKADAGKYADRYLGISAAERRWCEQLSVDPYTDNEVLRKAVHHVAQVEAATNVGLHFAAIPGIPYVGELQRAMTAIYSEDPAVLRQRRHDTLVGFGLTPAEIDRFENTLLLSPTRQVLLVDAVNALNGVTGRAELIRHALLVTDEEEVQVFLRSTALLVHAHQQQPVARIISGVRVPAAQLSSGRIRVFAAAESVYYTRDVAGYGRAILAALPADATGHELWIAGTVSELARQALGADGWDIHENAEPAPTAVATT